MIKRKLSVGLDLDGVLIDNWGAWKACFDDNASEHGHTKPFPGQAAYWDEGYDICHDCFTKCLTDPEVVSAYVPKPGVVDMIDMLKENDVTVNIVTSRPPVVYKATDEWVAKNLPINGDFYFTPGKGECADINGMGLMVDDAPHNILDFQEHQVPYIIFSHDYNQNVRGPRVFNISQLGEAIIDAKDGELCLWDDEN